MVKGSNIVSAVHHLKMAKEHFEDFRREYPQAMGSRLFKSYINKIDWIFKDLLAYPHLTQAIRDGFKAEIESDVFAIPAISEKVALLNPQQREMIEVTIDAMLSGIEIKISDISKSM
jgi:hypothetical protein